MSVVKIRCVRSTCNQYLKRINKFVVYKFIYMFDVESDKNPAN